jgi:uncharacterized protein YndB with AHSA1/START domain
LTGQPPRPTRAFEEREPPFRALPDDELRAAWATQARRKTEAVEALAVLGGGATVDFTGTAMTAARLSTHSRSEAAVHRWDIAGDDAVSDELLAQPELTAHAVSVLNAMPILLESSRARMTHAALLPLSVVLRAPGHPDVALGADADGNARFELVEGGTADGDPIVESDPAHRLLIIWGRRSSTRPVRIDSDPTTTEAIKDVLWPDAVSWPG